MNKRIGFVGIIVEHREEVADKMNHILTEFGHLIVARTGFPYKDRGVSVISLVLDATTDELGSLTGRLGNVKGISVKSALSKAR